jgi:probable HAF family extracellular repeat protein
MTKGLGKCVLIVGVLAGVAVPARAAPNYSFLSFDAPGGTGTIGNGINDFGVVAGQYTATGGATVGFVRAANGSFNAPIIAPGDNSNFTRSLGLNNAGTVVGDFITTTPGPVVTFHGYFLSGGSFTQYDIGGPVSTTVSGINNKGHFAGTFGSTVQPNQAFLNKNGVVETFTLDPTLPFFGVGLNDKDQVVGLSIDASNVQHGYVRDDGTGIITPIDVPGAMSTDALGINNAGRIVGSFVDGTGSTHGFLDVGGSFTQIDVPNSFFTVVAGINGRGDLTGTYGSNADGLQHGFIATVAPEPTSVARVGAGLLALWGRSCWRRRRPVGV